MDSITIIQLATLVATVIIAIAGIVSAYYWGYKPQKRAEKIRQLQKELLVCYRNIESLLEIEAEYITEEQISKRQTRQGRTLTKEVEPKRIQKRIQELSLIINE